MKVKTLPPAATRLFLSFFFALASAAPAKAAPGILTIEVTSARLHVGDLVKDAPEEMAKLDLGPAPAPAASRVISRSELSRLLRDAGYAGKAKLADAVRVVRKVKKMGQTELEAELRRAPLPKGVTLTSVSATRNVEVPDGFDKVTLDAGKLPRRAGSHRTTARVSFARGAEVLLTVPIAIELDISAAAAKADMVRGNVVTLVVRRGGVEITAAAVAGADADIGGTLPVTIRSTGKVVKAQLVEPTKAILVAEAP